MKALKTLLFNCLFLAIFAFIAFVLFEFYLRANQEDIQRSVSAVGIPIYEKDELNTYRHKPNSKAENGYGDPIPKIRINNIGLRDSNFEEKEYQKNILMIGDSFTFGTGVNQSQTFTEIFEKKLNQALPDPRVNWQVWNAGHIGYSIDNYLLLAKKYNEILKPELIIINIFVANDVTELRRKEWERDAIGRLERVKDQKVFANQEHQLESLLAPPPKSRAFNELQKRLMVLGHKWSFLPPEKNKPTLTWPVFLDEKNEEYDSNLPKYWNQFFGFWTELDGWSKEKNIPIIYTFIPMDVQVSDVYDKKYAIMYFDQEAKKLNRPQKKMQKFCDKNNLNCLDLLPLFRQDEKPEKLYFQHNADPHFDRYGHQKVADFLLDKILTKNKDTTDE